MAGELNRPPHLGPLRHTEAGQTAAFSTGPPTPTILYRDSVRGPTDGCTNRKQSFRTRPFVDLILSQTGTDIGGEGGDREAAAKRTITTSLPLGDNKIR